MSECIYIVDHTEPPAYKYPNFESNTLPQQFGSDFLCSAPGGKTLGIQRKSFPSDLISSIRDGRLAVQLSRMKLLTHAAFIFEGYPKFLSNGNLSTSTRGQAFTRAQYNGTLQSIQIEHGIPIFWVESPQFFFQAMMSFFVWCLKSQHGSLSNRPNPNQSTATTTLDDWRVHFLQGLPGIGQTQARRILEHCGGLPFLLTRDLSEVKGMGKGRVEQIAKMFKNGGV